MWRTTFPDWNWLALGCAFPLLVRSSRISNPRVQLARAESQEAARPALGVPPVVLLSPPPSCAVTAGGSRGTSDSGRSISGHELVIFSSWLWSRCGARDSTALLTL